MDTYNCYKCGDEWHFCPEDYYYKEERYPDICPFCTMTKIELFQEVYKEEGFLQAIKEVFRRI